MMRYPQLIDNKKLMMYNKNAMAVHRWAIANGPGIVDDTYSIAGAIGWHSFQNLRVGSHYGPDQIFDEKGKGKWKCPRAGGRQHAVDGTIDR